MSKSETPIMDAIVGPYIRASEIPLLDTGRQLERMLNRAEDAIIDDPVLKHCYQWRQWLADLRAMRMREGK